MGALRSHLPTKLSTKLTFKLPRCMVFFIYDPLWRSFVYGDFILQISVFNYADDSIYECTALRWC